MSSVRGKLSKILSVRGKLSIDSSVVFRLPLLYLLDLVPGCFLQ
jgi:hypothetical protein